MKFLDFENVWPSFGQNKTVAKTLWLKILIFCPKIMIHFCHLNQWNSDLNSFKLYPNNWFYHLQPYELYCYIKLSLLIILDEKRIHNFWTKFENRDFSSELWYRVSKGKHLCFTLLWRIEICMQVRFGLKVVWVSWVVDIWLMTLSFGEK